jgi:rhamnulokinase
MGNLLVQARASGELDSLSEMRTVIRQSSQLATFDPRSAASWDAAAQKFAELQKASV